MSLLILSQILGLRALFLKVVHGALEFWHWEALFVLLRAVTLSREPSSICTETPDPTITG